MRDFLKRIGSIRWTIAILLLLAGVGALGTFLPQGQAVEASGKLADPAAAKFLQALGFVGIFQSVWLRILLISLVFNMLACIIIRIPAAISVINGEAAVRREPVLVLNADDENLGRLDRSLKSLGFREKKGVGKRLYSKGTTGYVMTMLAHASIVVIMTSSLIGSILGFVATQRIQIGSTSASAYNWKTEQDMKLPFQIQPMDMLFLPNAVSVKMEVMRVESGMTTGVINSYEGGTFSVPGLPGSVTLERFNVDTGQFIAVWVDPDGGRTRLGRGSVIGESGLALVPMAYATWPERQVLVKTRLSIDGRTVQAGEISVNHPLSHNGVTIYLTDYGKDQFGFPYAGFQFVNDPGRPGVWAGCVVFLIALTGTLFIRHRCVVLKEEEGVWKMYMSSMGDREEAVRKLRSNVTRDSDIDRETVL